MAHEQVMDVVVPGGTGWIEIVVATIAYFIVSFVWWGPLMGGKWGREMGMDMSPENQPGMKEMGKPMALQLLGTFLMAYVFWVVTHAFTTSGVHDTTDAQLMMNNPAFMDILAGAFFTTLGFVVPMQLGRIAWEKASWTLFGINTAGHFIGLFVMGLVFMLL